jgi:outer membrane protein OmpA-like peptidoglycan-associated protein
MLAMPATAPAQHNNRDRAAFQKALKLQNRGRYDKAVKVYEKYLHAVGDWEAKYNLAFCYGKLKRPDDQERMLTDLVFSKPEEADFKLQLAELLKQQGKYAAAKTWYEKYATQSTDSVEARRRAATCEQAMLLQKDSLGYNVGPTSNLNTPLDELLSGLDGNALVFVSNRKGGAGLYQATRATDGALGKVVAGGKATGLVKGVNLALHSPNQDAVKSKLSSPAGANQSLSQQYGIEQFCISPNGKFKIVAMEAAGGFGGMDLYISLWENGGWSAATNLGEVVNSAAQEELPFVSNDSTLYFSSNRGEGMGGYDIYSAEGIGGTWINLRHETVPLNSSYDDFGFCMVPGQPAGYFTTNRPGGSGGYDVWNLRRYKVLEGQLVNAETYLPLAGARVDLVDINQAHHIYLTDASGHFRHVMRAGQEVFGQFFHPDFHDQSQNISLRTIGYDQNMRHTIAMEGIQHHGLEGVVTDAQTRKPLEGVTVRLVSKKDLRSFSNPKGAYSQTLQPDTYYRAIFYLSGYIPQIIEFTTGPDGQPQGMRRDIALRKGGFHYLEGRAIDTERDIVVGEASIHFLDSKTQREVQTQTAGPDGMFYKVLEAGQDYTVIASKGKYLSARLDLPKAEDRADTLLKTLELVPLMPDKVVKTVYFPYKSSTIDEAGFRDVSEIVYLLKSNPTIGLELSAYTDARGGAEFNKKLSQQRADALAAYIVAQGVEGSRITAIGRGEEQPFNNCVDGVECTDELHGQNRRAEIRIVRLGK